MTTDLKRKLLGEDAELRASFERNTEKRNLALAVRAMRKWAGLTQVEVAELSGLSQSHVSKIESATGPMPQTETLQKYAAACKARVWIEFQPELRQPEEAAADNGPIAVAVL